MLDYPGPWPLPSMMVPQAVDPVWEMISPPGDMPINLSAVKDWLGIAREDQFFDAEKTAMLSVAIAAIEQHCQMDIGLTQWVGSFPGFYDPMRINRRPFGRVIKVEYVDTAGVITTLPPSAYLAIKSGQSIGLMQRADGTQWPATAPRPDAVRITVESGFAAVPHDIQHAVLLTLSAIDANRGDSGSGGGGRQTVFALRHPEMMGGSSVLPREAQALLAKYKLRVLGL